MSNPRPSAIEAAIDGKSYYVVKRALKIISVILAVILLTTSIMFVTAYVAIEQRSFPISIYNSDKSKNCGISISESYDFANPTSKLNAIVPESMTNISVFDLPSDIDNNEQKGCHNGDSYVAYTFFLKNTVEVQEYVNEKIGITLASKNADAAIRLRLYRNGEEVTYAKVSASGMPEYGTTPFASEDLVYENKTALAPNQIIRYTLVIWLEGDDPDCIDAIMGGFVGFSMEFDAEPAEE